ncbi:MAG: asparagine synthase (glutamine-hydrolyzing) [Candidatus Sericytochromatia bacterium]
MCGIAGILNFTREAVAEPLLRAMARAIAHRGPDGEGIYIDGPLGLAHRRLSILDLSQRGHQPMASPDRSCWISYNGEVYNYLELRAELSAMGYAFHSGTDTEVILAAYQAWGPDCVSRFNGMWSFAIWDSLRQRLFCSRDRFGIKPFYYYLSPAGFVFASEPKALLQHPDVPNKADENSLYLFLRTGQSHVGKESFWQDIQQLEPGHSLLIEAGQLTLQPYWRMDQIPLSHLSEAEAIETFRELFASSVSLRFRSDVPVGTCLSGGLDSSSIVCVARQLRDQLPEAIYNQESFSACYDQPDVDERPFIEKVLAATGARRNFVFPSAAELITELEALVYAQDEPFPTLSMYSQWCVMKRVGQSPVKVLLDGQGADEMMAGYGYNSIFWAELRERGQWRSLLQEWSALWAVSPKAVLRGLPRFLAPERLRAWEQRQHGQSLLDADFSARWHTEALSRLTRPKVYGERLRNEGFHLMKLSLIPLLRYEDRNSMAYSLETRLPFLDYRLVQFLFSLPSEMLIRQSWSKWILRQAMQGVLPPEIQWRRDKKGFPVPQASWLRRELAPVIKEILWDPRFQSRPYWQGRRVAVAYDRFLAGELPAFSLELWRLVSAELWLRRFVDRRPDSLLQGVQAGQSS